MSLKRNELSLDEKSFQLVSCGKMSAVKPETGTCLLQRCYGDDFCLYPFLFGR